MVFVSASGGGYLDYVNDPETMGEGRTWNGTELHGALARGTAGNNIGYEFHLDSYQRFTRTEVEIDGNSIIYVIRDLNSWEVLDTYY